MSSCEDLDAHNEFLAGYEPPSESELFEVPIWLDDVKRVNKDSFEAQDMVRKKAAWRLRVSERETRMFRLRRTGELAMSTTIASLGIYAAAHSLGEGMIEGTAISLFAIIWSLGVCREVVKDLNSPEYMNLVKNSVEERMYHDATMASLEVQSEL